MGRRVRIDTNDLQAGMYIVALDRPWLDTPFPFQGFHVQSLKQLQQVRQLCRYVYVDPDLTLGKEPPHPRRIPGAVGPGHPPHPVTRTLHEGAKLAPPVKQRYADTTRIEEEITPARLAHRRTREVLDHIFHDVRLGRMIPTAEAKTVVSELTESVIRNPDALVWLTHLKNKDEYTSIHSMNVCILALAFGRHLGLSKGTLTHLGIGGLLHDVGKMRIDTALLNKTEPLTDPEMELMRRHADFGHDILRGAKDLPGSAADIAWSHHERMDGSGYPRGLKGEAISYFGRIVAIIDSYDAVTSERIYHGAMSSLEALERLYEWRTSSFDPALVEQFIQCLGIYPAGSEVELTSGEVGVVVSVNRKQRLRPKVLLLFDADKTPYDPPRLVDLMNRTEDEQGRPYNILTVLERGAYGIDVRALLQENPRPA